MLLLLIFVLAIFVSLWSYIKWNKVKNYWKLKGVPHYPPHPIMGSLTFLQRQNPSIWMRKAYNDFKSPYMGIWLFWRPALVINSPEIARRILVKDSENFRNHFLSSGKTDTVGSLNLFTLKDPTWTMIRRHINRVLTTAQMKKHNRIIQDKTKDLIQHIRDETVKNNILQLRKTLAEYTSDIIGESAFGIMSETVKTGDSIMNQVTKEFMKFSLFRGLSWSSIFFFPELVDVFRFSFLPKATVERLRHICRNIIQQRGGYDKEISEPKDLLDALIKMKQVAVSEGRSEEDSENMLLAQASVLLLGGFDTTAAILSWIFYELAWHPVYQQKLYKEVLKAKQHKVDNDWNPSAVSEFTYMDCIIKETLRLFPPMGWLDRVAAHDYKIDNNLTIPAGTPVYVNAVAMQVDPQYFPEPMVFNPDRFLPENEKSIIPFTYTPFGEGPRICVGMRLGLHLIRQALSSLIYNFEIRSLPGTPIPTEVQVEKKGMFFMPLDDRMLVDFVPRER